jgi:2-methylaconitate cis-trans-isomerase PrpF
MAVAGAAAIEGTTIFQILGQRAPEQETLRVGHPGGVFDVAARVERQGGAYELKEAAYGRTARRLMEGYVLVPADAFSPAG